MCVDTPFTHSLELLPSVVDNCFKAIGIYNIEVSIGDKARNAEDCVDLWIETCHLDELNQ